MLVLVEELSLNGSILTVDGDFNTDDGPTLGAVRLPELNPVLSNDDHIHAIIRADAIGVIDLNNGLLKATYQHLQIIKRNGNWMCVRMQSIVVGDILYHITDGEITVTSVVIDDTTPYVVYKLDTEPNDTYFANGILTHNRKEICPPDEICFE